jgi:hypothetical protein
MHDPATNQRQRHPNPQELRQVQSTDTTRNRLLSTRRPPERRHRLLLCSGALPQKRRRRVQLEGDASTAGGRICGGTCQLRFTNQPTKEFIQCYGDHSADCTEGATLAKYIQSLRTCARFFTHAASAIA